MPDSSPDPQPTPDDSPWSEEKSWIFTKLLDADARREMVEMNEALERSKNCKSIWVGFRPRREV